MKKTIAVLLAVWAVEAGAAPGGNAGPAQLGSRVPPFTATVTDDGGSKSTTHAFDSRQSKRVTAYLFVGTTCPATNAYASRMSELAKTYGAKGVDFIYIFPNRNDEKAAIAAFHKQKQLGGRYIDEGGAHLAQLFGAQKTSELFLADKRGTIVYHGAVDDSRDPSAVKQRYLKTALDEVLAGKSVTTPQSDVFA